MYTRHENVCRYSRGRLNPSAEVKVRRGVQARSVAQSKILVRKAAPLRRGHFRTFSFPFLGLSRELIKECDRCALLSRRRLRPCGYFHAKECARRRGLETKSQSPIAFELLAF